MGKDKHTGFTLVEILVVIAVVTVVGVILTEVFLRSIRGGNKAELLAIIKQNGQAALETMDKKIRSSKDIVCPATPSPSAQLGSEVIAFTEPDGTYTRYRLIKQQIAEDHPRLGGGTTQQQFLLDICTNVDYVDASPVTITDMNKVVVVGPSSGHIFTRVRQAGFKDVVTISFSVKPGQDIPRVVADQIDLVPFTTTIQLR